MIILIILRDMVMVMLSTRGKIRAIITIMQNDEYINPNYLVAGVIKLLMNPSGLPQGIFTR